MKLYYTDHFELPLPREHRFPMSKYRRLRERLCELRFSVSSTAGPRAFELRVPHASSNDELLLAHTAEYLQKIETGDLTRVEERRIGFPWSPELVLRSRYSTGATVAAACDAIRESVAVNLAGGTHHAFADAAAGYCVFNDVVVAARVLQRQSSVRQVLIIDCDVHQGNGTASITENDTTIFTLSLHGERNYPFRKATSDLDVALADGTGDATYVHHLTRAIDVATARMVEAGRRPEIVFFIAGADPFVGDRLGRLALSKAGLHQRHEIVCAYCRAHQFPLVIVMGGGYADAISDIVDIHVDAVTTAYDMLWAPRHMPQVTRPAKSLGFTT